MHFDHFIIRTIEEKDAESFFEFIDSNRERFKKYMPVTVNTVLTLADTIKLINKRLELMARNEAVPFIVCDLGNNQIIGSVLVKNIDSNALKSELGFFIDGEYENKGITTKAVRKVIGHCFEVLSLNKVYMRIAEDNIASRRVAEKVGAILEGKLRHDHRTDEDELIDVLYYGLLKSEFLL